LEAGSCFLKVFLKGHNDKMEAASALGSLRETHCIEYLLCAVTGMDLLLTILFALIFTKAVIIGQ
jgi:hypothetical protein